MKNSNDFLKTEVDIYHDVRPPVVEEELSPQPVKEEEHKESKGIFRIFRSPDKEIQKQENCIEKQTMQPIFSDNAVSEMKHSDRFIKQEVNAYHDVRPATKEKPSDISDEQPKAKKDSKGILSMFKRQHTDSKDRPAKGKVFKKTSEKRATSVEKNQKSLLSTEAIADMLNSDNFLKNEVETYHDVRPMLNEVATEAVIKAKLRKEDNREEAREDFFGDVELPLQPANTILEDEIAKYCDLNLISSVNKNVVERPKEELVSHEERNESKGFFKLFKKKKGQESEKEPLQLSDTIPRNTEDSVLILKNETDVRPVVETSLDIETTTSMLSESFPTSAFHDDIEAIIPKTTNFINNELDQYEDAIPEVKSIPTSENSSYIPPTLSEDALLDMITSSNFLREEIGQFHDVRPIIKPQVSAEVKEDIKDKHGKGIKFFGLFSKRKSQEREPSVEKDHTDKLKKDKKKKKSKDGDVKMKASETEKSVTESVAEPIVISKNDINDFLKGEIDRYHDVRPLIEKCGEHEGGLFEAHSKKINPTDEGSKTVQDKEPIVADLAEIRQTIWEDDLKSRKITTVSHEAAEHCDKIVSVTKEIYVVNPSIMKDVADLDEDIKRKIAQAKFDADGLDRDTSKPFIRENFSVETKIVDRVIPVASDTETVTETEVIYENVPSSITRDIYTLAESKIPKNTSESLTKGGSYDTTTVLEPGTLNYSDVKPIVTTQQENVISESKHKDVYEEAMQQKVGSASKLFDNTHKSEEHITKSPDDDKENLGKSDKTKAKERKEKREKRKSGGFFSLFSKSSQDRPDADKTSHPMAYSPELVKTLQDTTNFLNTELTQYEDAKYVLVTDLDDDVEVEEHTKSGLFSIFSKKKDSPKISKKLFKKNKRERSQESDSMEKTYQKLEDLDEAIDKKIKDIQKQFNEGVEMSAQHIGTAGEKMELLPKDGDSKSKPKKVMFSEFIEASSADGDEGVTDSTEKLKVSLQNESPLLAAHFTQVSQNLHDSTDQAGGKLGQGTDAISKDFTEKTAQAIDHSLSQRDKSATILKETHDELYPVLKETASSFVTDMLESFDTKLEHVKENSQSKHTEVLENMAKDREAFVEEVNEKYKETEDLGRQLIAQTKQNLDQDFLTTERTFSSCEAELAERQMKGLKEMPVGIVDEVKLLVDNKNVTAKGLVLDIKEDETDASADTVGKTADVTRELTESVQESQKKTGSFLSKLTDKFAGKSKDAESCLKSETQDYEKAIEGKIGKEKEATASACKTSEFIIADGLDHIKSEIETTKKNFSDNADSLMEELNQTISEEGITATEEVKSVKKKSGSFISKLGNKISGKGKEVQKSSDSILNNAEECANVVIEKTSSVGEQVKVESEQVINTAQSIKLTSEEISDGIQKDCDDIRDYINYPADELVKKVTEVRKSFTESDDLAQAGVKDQIEQSKSKIVEEVDTVLNKSGDTLSHVKDNVKEGKKKSGGFFSKLGAKISGKSKEVEKSRIEAANDAKQEVEQAATELSSAASQIASDLHETTQAISADKLDIVHPTAEERKSTKSFLEKEQSLIEGANIIKNEADNLKDCAQVIVDSKKAFNDNLQMDVQKAGVSLQSAESQLTGEISDIEVVIDGDTLKNARVAAFEPANDLLEPTEKELFKKIKNTSKKLDEQTKQASSGLGKIEKEITGKSDKILKLAADSLEQTSHLESNDGTTQKVQCAIEDLRSNFHPVQNNKQISEYSVKSTEVLTGGDPSLLFDPQDKYKADGKIHLGPIKQRTTEFLEAETSEFFRQIPRTVSDYGGGQIKESESGRGSISEANIDLSNLPRNIDQDSVEASAYVTSPVLARRAVSQKYLKGERPDVIEIKNISEYNIGDATKYVVTEPDEHGIAKSNAGKKPLFHIESEDDDSLDIRKESIERSDSVRSNVLETLTERDVDNLLDDLTKTLGDAISKPAEKAELTQAAAAEQTLQEHIKESKTDVELIEQKLRDLDKALDSLEETERETDGSKKEKKLKRVERKFERMASEVLEEEAKDAKSKQIATPDVEEKRESEFQKLVSQISLEEVSDFQKEYSHLWDENTFSKSEDWGSKTPDSQADAQELPKGDEQAQSMETQQGTSSVKTSVTRRRPFRYEISMEDQTEVNLREHDWRFNLPRYAETEEAQATSEKDKSKKVADQHQLSEEMKELLKDLEKESKH